ncbi:hypothetical protein D3C74_264110 [compost metagenome]
MLIGYRSPLIYFCLHNYIYVNKIAGSIFSIQMKQIKKELITDQNVQEDGITMPKPFSSLQAQSPIADAQQSVGKAHRAVRQAQSHPSEDTVSNAYNAMNKAEKALQQAEEYLSQQPEPVERAREELGQDRYDLSQVEDQLK